MACAWRKRAEELLELVEKTEAEFAVKEETIGGDIHIGGGETRVMRHLAMIMSEIREEYPGIRYHIHSGNSEDVTERLDKGLLDFGVLIQPADLTKYDYVNLPGKRCLGRHYAQGAAPWRQAIHCQTGFARRAASFVTPGHTAQHGQK